MPKRYLKRPYRSQESEVRSQKVLFWILNSVFWILLPIFSGCAGNKITGAESKALPWQTYLSDKERHGSSEDALVPPLRLSSSFFIADAPVFKFFIPYYPSEYSSPAIVDSMVYAGTADKYLYAIDLTKESKVWKFKTTGAVESSPTLALNKVYFGTGDGVFYCLDAKDGHEIWRFQATTEIISSPIIEGGTVYFNSADDKLYALKVETGEKIWQYSRRYVKKAVKRTFASPAAYGDKIYLSSADGYVFAVEKTSGREVWQKKIIGEDRGGLARYTPAIKNGLVYCINGDGFLVALDAESGEEKWRFTIVKSTDFSLYRDYLFIAGDDGSIMAMKEASREIIWRAKISQGIPVSVIAVDSYVVVASNYTAESVFSTGIGSYIDTFDIGNGIKVWNEKIDSTVSASLSSAYNHLFLVTDRGYLRIYKSSR